VLGALLILLPVAGVALSIACVVYFVLQWPGAVLALSWSGFWLYLGALDALDVASRSAFTALVYTAIAVALGVFTWSRRATLRERLLQLTPPARWWLAVAGALAAWFLLIGATISHGPLAHRLVGLFVISTIPTLVAVAAASRRDLEQARAALVILGIVFLLVGALVALQADGGVLRFSPIDELDPISAALIPALACAAAATYRPRTGRGLIEQLTVCALLAAGTAVPHARGPLLTLVVTVVVIGLVSRSRQALAAVAAVATGVLVGLVVAQNVSSGLNVLGNPVGPNGGSGSSNFEPISSFSIRKQWMREAVRRAPDRPVFGHGVGMFVDRTPEAGRMGVAGQRVYPHNDIVESAYSLGAAGFVLFLAFLVIPVFVLMTRLRARSESLRVFAVGLFTFAFVESNFSGEIGTDVVLWSSAAIVVLVLLAPPAPDPERA
jgi:hypothetical protein